jgi:SAM-dependent methyltransferase
MTKTMYSAAWFDVFSASASPESVEREVQALRRLLPMPEYRRVLDVGCGIGRISGPLNSLGHQVTGIDVNVPALLEARARSPGPTYMALDQRHVSAPRWTFDAALILWNSLGFTGRSADRELLESLHRILRSGGVLVLDLYHPEWLQQNGHPEPRGGTTAQRRVVNGRCVNDIRYADGSSDRIEFEVYRPDEIRLVSESIGFETLREMVWWDDAVTPSPKHARYQLHLRRTSDYSLAAV